MLRDQLTSFRPAVARWEHDFTSLLWDPPPDEIATSVVLAAAGVSDNSPPAAPPKLELHVPLCVDVSPQSLRRLFSLCADGLLGALALTKLESATECAVSARPPPFVRRSATTRAGTGPARVRQPAAVINTEHAEPTHAARTAHRTTARSTQRHIQACRPPYLALLIRLLPPASRVAAPLHVPRPPPPSQGPPPLCVRLQA